MQAAKPSMRAAESISLQPRTQASPASCGGRRAPGFCGWGWAGATYHLAGSGFRIFANKPTRIVISVHEFLVPGSRVNRA
jgi:hypothetical protein